MTIAKYLDGRDYTLELVVAALKAVPFTLEGQSLNATFTGGEGPDDKEMSADILTDTVLSLIADLIIRQDGGEICNMDSIAEIIQWISENGMLECATIYPGAINFWID